MNLKPVLTILLAASLFGVSTPLAKLLLGDLSPVALAGLLYLGVFAGLACYTGLRNAASALGLGPRAHREASLDRTDLPWLVGAVAAGGVAGPVCLMAGLSRISGFSASLLLNFEGVATGVLAVLFFHENAGRRIWAALGLMTTAGILLSLNPQAGRFSPAGPVLVVLAMVFWGLDNNLTRRISEKDPVQIAGIKGLAAGAVSTAAAFVLGLGFRPDWTMAYGLAVGAVCYGLSLVLFVRALKSLGAFRTAAFFSFAPFVGCLASLVILGDRVGWPMAAAGFFMLGGVVLIIGERHVHPHRHPRTVHVHSHSHGDLHHAHVHPAPGPEPHTHEHAHEEKVHVHGHWPDTHHRHVHDGRENEEEP